MKRKSIMIDMDEVIVKGRFTEFLDKFLGGVDFEKEEKKNLKRYMHLKICIEKRMVHLLNLYQIVLK